MYTTSSPSPPGPAVRPSGGSGPLLVSTPHATTLSVGPGTASALSDSPEEMEMTYFEIIFTLSSHHFLFDWPFGLTFQYISLCVLCYKVAAARLLTSHCCSYMTWSYSLVIIVMEGEDIRCKTLIATS